MVREEVSSAIGESCQSVDSNQIRPSSEHFLHLLMLDLGVELGEARLLLCEVVEGAVVLLSVTMLGAVHKGALTGHLHKANLLIALPALVLVLLLSQSTD